jgi:hypothetical protein
VLDGSFMTQELNFTAHSSESSSSSSEPLGVASASIADPYVLLKMVDGTIQLLVGGIIYPLAQHVFVSCFSAVVLSKIQSNFEILSWLVISWAKFVSSEKKLAPEHFLQR